MGEELEQGKGHQADEQGHDEGFAVGQAHPAVLSRPHVEAENGLAPMGQAHGEGDDNGLHLGDDAGDRQGNVAAVDGQGAIFAQQVVHDDVDHHHHDVVEEVGGAQLADLFDLLRPQLQRLPGHPHPFKPGQVAQAQQEGEDLAKDRGQSRPLNAPLEDHHEQPVQHDVYHRPGHGAGHGVSGTAVPPDKGGGPCGRQMEGQAQGGDAQVALAVGENRVGGAAQAQDGVSQQKDHGSQDHSQQH